WDAALGQSLTTLRGHEAVGVQHHLVPSHPRMLCFCLR
ncbi:unnamed protein product, partial [Tetraodon nigroviridis]